MLRCSGDTRVRPIVLSSCRTTDWRSPRAATDSDHFQVVVAVGQRSGARMLLVPAGRTAGHVKGRRVGEGLVGEECVGGRRL